MVKVNKIIKYILLILIMALSLTACNGNKDKDDNPDKPPVEVPKDPEKPEEPDDPKDPDQGENTKENSEIIKEFRMIAEKKPAPDVLIKFIDENIEKVSKEDADEMINILDMSLEANKEIYADRIFELDKDDELINIDGEEIDFKAISIEEIKNDKLRVEVDYLYKNMYKLTNVEGAFYPIIDYKALKKYDDYINDEGREYIEIRSIDSENRTMGDGGLYIEFNELLDRILRIEKFLEKYPDSLRKTEMLYDYDYKITAYINGLPNTPIMDYESKKITDEVLNSYNIAIEKGNYFSGIVKEHLNNIEENDNIIDDEITEKAYKLISKAVENFKMNK